MDRENAMRIYIWKISSINSFQAFNDSVSGCFIGSSTSLHQNKIIYNFNGVYISIHIPKQNEFQRIFQHDIMLPAVTNENPLHNE